MSSGGGTGMAGLVVTAVVAAVVALAVAFLLPSGSAPAPATPAAASPSTDDLRAEVTRLRAEVAELRGSRASRPAAAPGGAPGAAAPGGIAAGAPVPGEEAPLPASRAELVALIDERIADKGGAALPVLASPPAPEKKSVTIEEAGAAIGLSAFEIDAVRRVYGDAENEMLAAVMGTTDLDAIRQEVKAAKEDPDKKAALVNKAVGNVFRNLGHVMTLEDRRDRELKKVLPEEKVRGLKGYELKPTFDDAELEGLLEDVFEN